jgi:hypothetical protein
MDIAAFVVSVVGLSAACAALWISLRGARAAERSATASEDSAQAAKVSAGAATRNADAAEQGLALNTRRVQSEEQQRREAAAPRFEPVRRHSPGTFNLHGAQPRFAAHLRNVGGSTALIESVRLRHVGGETEGKLMPGDETGVVEEVSQLHVSPGERVTLIFEAPEIECLRTTSEPLGLEVQYSSAAGQNQLLLRLGRLPADHTRRLQWRSIPET